MMEVVSGWDRWLFEAMNQAHRSPFFDWIMPILSDKHYFIVPAIAIGVALVVWGGSKGRWAVAAVLLSVILADQAAGVVKVLAARPRPCHVLPGAVIFGGCTASFALPSSHATNIVAFAAALGYYYRRWIGGLGTLALGVGYSRVYLASHYPGDVLAGALVGLVAAAVVVALVQTVRSQWASRHTDIAPESDAPTST